jgi:hypothetical protein
MELFSIEFLLTLLFTAGGGGIVGRYYKSKKDKRDYGLELLEEYRLENDRLRKLLKEKDN